MPATLLPTSHRKVKSTSVVDQSRRATLRLVLGRIVSLSLIDLSDDQQRDDLTKEAFTEDKWFMTGDIGQWNEDGTLSIIDRKKVRRTTDMCNARLFNRLITELNQAVWR